MIVNAMERKDTEITQKSAPSSDMHVSSAGVSGINVVFW